MKLLSWNVNGVRAAHGKGLLDWMAASRADVIFLQEVKALEADVEHIVWPAGYEWAWNAAEKKGYSGTALFSRTKPLSVVRGIGSAAHDAEGRAITAEFPDCYVVGVYVPNAQPELVRIGFRQEWDRALLGHMKKLEKKKPVLLCGDWVRHGTSGGFGSWQLQRADRQHWVAPRAGPGRCRCLSAPCHFATTTVTATAPVRCSHGLQW